METLINSLTEQTQELKALYLEATEDFAKKEFSKIEKASKMPVEKWYEKFEIPTELKYVHNGCFVPKHMLENMLAKYSHELTQTLTPVSSAYNGKALYKMRDARYAAQKIASEGVESHVAKKLKLANTHYTDSIAKLAFRIEKKGLNENNLTLSSSRIAMNFETRITDGVKSVRAFTILAWGEINAPHYRYLIK